MKTILVVDDELKITRLLRDYLQQAGFRVVTAADGPAALTVARAERPDMIVLDLGLPGLDGLDVTRTLRRSSDVPIIMLTARGEITDKVVGLELGADDYLAKPFEPRELVARIQSVLRRTRPLKDTRNLSFHRLIIDPAKQMVLMDGRPVDLTTNEFRALVLLAANAGKVLNRDQILQELRGIDCDAFNRSVDITVSRLRQKLRDNPKSPEFIKTVWGSGYVFIANPV